MLASDGHDLNLGNQSQADVSMKNINAWWWRNFKVWCSRNNMRTSKIHTLWSLMALPCFLGQRLYFLAPELDRGVLICGRVANRERGGIASKHFRTWALEGCVTSPIYMGLLGSWVNKTLKRFLMVTRWRENLSSGENRAGAEIMNSKCQKKRKKESPTHQDEQTWSFCLHLWLSEANVSIKRNAYICINAPSECTLCCLPRRECTSDAWRDEGLVDGWPLLTPLRISSPMTGRGKYLCSGGPIIRIPFHRRPLGNKARLNWRFH